MSIQSEINRLKGVKTDIRNAIISKGVEFPEGTPFGDYAGKISQIESGSGGLVFREKIGGIITNTSTQPIEIEINSKTFLLFGVAMNIAATDVSVAYAPLIMYAVNGSFSISSISSTYFEINTSETDNGYLIQLTAKSYSEKASLSFSMNTSGFAMLHVFEG